MFSVVMPVFNKRPYVVSAVESVLAQSWADFELIVVDDGSSDGSREAVAGIDDPRLQLLVQENQGVAAARNHGIRIAGREWVAFIDADDAWSEEHLDELRRIVQALPDSGLIATNYRSGSEFRPEPSTGHASIARIDYFLQASRRIGIVFTSASAARRDALDAIGGFPPVGSGEDLLCWAALALRYPVGYSTRPTAFYRLGTGGIMDQGDRLEPPAEMPRSLADLSPSVAYLLEQLGSAECARQRDGVNCYIASRIEAAIRAEYAVAAFARGKRWAALGNDYAQYFGQRTRALLKAPNWLLRLAWLTRRFARRRLLSLKRARS